MDRITADRVNNVSTGMFEASNLLPINGEVGVNVPLLKACPIMMIFSKVAMSPQINTQEQSSFIGIS